MDPLRLVLLAVAFGALVTAHVALVFGLAARPPRWRALVALVVPPLAPYWGWQERHRVASTTWMAALVAYGVALFFVAR
jgi:uncharacterized membrane protein YphA (DoxX/SURF4 family)